MRILDLFSGIGGFSLGLEAAGMETVAFCEQNEFCQKILAQHWPTLPIHSDIKELNGYEYRGSVELVCGGFPCQPFSVAGKQLGAEDDRALWKEMLRVIREVAPKWVIGENVSGIIPMELDNVLSDLEGEGYTCWTFVLPASSVDARHRRDRVWVVAHTSGNVGDTEHDGLSASEIARGSGKTEAGSPQGSINAVESEGASRPSNHGAMVVADSKDQRRESGIYEERPRPEERQLARSSQDVADTSGERLQRAVREREAREERQPSRHAAQCGIWLAEPNVGRVANGVPNRVDRIKALGNAVVPPLVAEIGRIVMEFDQTSY